MTKAPILFAVATLLISTAAIAAKSNFAQVDKNGDGKVTLEELVIVVPKVTESSFKVADVNGDGTLSQEEYDAVVK